MITIDYNQGYWEYYLNGEYVKGYKSIEALMEYLTKKTDEFKNLIDN